MSAGAFAVLATTLTLLLGANAQTKPSTHHVWTVPEVGALPRDAHGLQVRKGRDLITATYAYIGPNVPDAAKRYAGNNLACTNCHLQAGTKKFGIPLFGLFGDFPQYSKRLGAEISIEDRVNSCMTRSMNGRPLPRDSVEMIAMEAYITDLNERYSAMSKSRRAADEQAAFVEPQRAADPAAGQLVYAERCAVCHGDNGEGLLATGKPSDGYLFPPLWGPDTFNDGAGMHRVLTAARFIKARMPFGGADLTDDQAFDVAAYVNSHPRPEMSGLERDYPDRTAKPVDSPYGPYADPFSQAQHQYGPYKEIRAWYAAEKAEKGTQPKQ